MDKFSRKEKDYRETIDQQKEQIGRYEKKLRDVIQAYKGLQKEKEALEASFKALTELKSPTESDSSQYPLVNKDETQNESSVLNVDTPETSMDTGNQEEVIKQLKAQLATLSASLGTITAEKSRIENNFQQDRKRLLQEKDDLEKSLNAACSQAESASQMFKQQLSELKSSLSVERAERSKEATNNQVILRELQKTIAEERQKREALELELNTKSSRLSQANAASSQLETAERKIRDLSNELESAKTKLRIAEQKLEQPSPHLLQLQEEMADLKVQHRLAIQQEQRNATEAKEAARSLAEAHENRVASLEARLAEFSERIGAYDRLRQQDLATVSRLKEQLNTIQKDTSSSSSADEQEYDLDKLIDKMRTLKMRLVELSKQTSIPVNLSAILGGENSVAITDQHEACQLELLKLKQELDWYKKEEQLNERKARNSLSASEDEVNQMRVQIQFLRDEFEHSEQKHSETLKALQESWTKERLSWKDELSHVERSHRARVAELEQQLQKQRERSLALLQEKDDELASLKETLSVKSTSPSSPRVRSSSQEQDNMPSYNEEWPESLAPLGSMTLGASASGGQILHYVEELARKEVEIQGLRRSKNQLEATVREMQMTSLTMEHKMAQQKSQLHEELARLERNQSREGANLEYLKNVLLEFFLRSDASSQSHMFNAIATCLHFSPKEIQRVWQQHPKWKRSSTASGPVSPNVQHS
nr:EOG090X04IO [Macrothrix elegans]